MTACGLRALVRHFAFGFGFVLEVLFCTAAGLSCLRGSRRELQLITGRLLEAQVIDPDPFTARGRHAV